MLHTMPTSKVDNSLNLTSAIHQPLTTGTRLLTAASIWLINNHALKLNVSGLLLKNLLQRQISAHFLTLLSIKNHTWNVLLRTPLIATELANGTTLLNSSWRTQLLTTRTTLKDHLHSSLRNSAIQFRTPLMLQTGLPALWTMMSNPAQWTACALGIRDFH